MGKISDIVMEINELVEAGMSAKFIAVKLNIPIQWAEQAIQDREDLELMKQYEAMQYAEHSADADAVYYGEMN
jgi:hypothetical protein